MSADRIGHLLAKLSASEAPAAPPPAKCGGALLYVTRDTAVKLAERGFRWKIDPERMPPDGKHTWRVACSDEVMSVVRTAELPEDASDEERARAPRYVVTYGLCSRCNGYELAMRKKLREEARVAEDEAKNGRGRKRGFREDAAE